MKFLHLSDLHIGKMLNAVSMINEQINFFAQVIDYIRSEKPYAVVIAGDIYDRSVPSTEAVLAFDDFLTALVESGAVIIIISGNHDSPARLNFASRLLSHRQLFLYGAFNGSLQKLTFNDETGAVNFWLLPFINPASVRSFHQGANIQDYNAALDFVLKNADIDYSMRNIFVSHQYYTKAGLSLERSESELKPIGGLDAIDISLIKNFDYAALGHLHGRQKAGEEHICYAGSPLKYSFSEAHHKKSVNLVEIREKGNLTVTALPIKPIHNMQIIKGKLSTLLDKPEPCEDYIYAILTDEEEIIDPMEKLRNIYPNIMKLDFDNSRTALDLTEAYQGGEAESLSAYDLFSEFFLLNQGSVMSDEQIGIVQALLGGGNE